LSPTNPYLDGGGRPLLRKSIVGFLDLLGFSQMAIAETEFEPSQKLLRRIAAAIDDSRSYVRRILADDFASRPVSGTVKFFSDNLVLAYPCDLDEDTPEATAGFVVQCAQHYQLQMSLHGFFLRGSLTLGSVCLTEDIIFGASLIESYQLESKAAIVPRVLLSDTLRGLLIPSLRTEHSLAAEARQSICRDIDGWWFVNYLQAATHPDGQIDWELIHQDKVNVLAATAGVTRHDILPKFGWVARYHNLFCYWHRLVPGFTDDVLIPRHDAESMIQRIDDIRS
jgi:hypothetical protein